MLVNIKLQGTAPLVMHNVRLADKDDEYTRGIAALTAKKKNQTDMDRADIAKLEWMGGLYLDGSNKVVMPVANLVRAFRDAAAITRRGKDIYRALLPTAMFVPLIYPGPSDIAKLYADPSYTLRRLVKVGASKITRIRPQFPQWGLQATFELLEDLMDLRDLEAIVERAGQTTGLGDARLIGFGRFGSQVVAAELAKAA